MDDVTLFLHYSCSLHLSTCVSEKLYKALFQSVRTEFSFFFQSCKKMIEINKKEHSANSSFPSLDVGKQALNVLQS